MKIYPSLFLVILLSACHTKVNDTSTPTGGIHTKPVIGQWVSIFNGVDLTGWKPKFTGYKVGENYKNTFAVEDGKLIVSYREYDSFNGEFGHLFYQENLSFYRMRFEYRFVGDQVADAPEWARANNGLMLHCQSPESMGIKQNFPVSLETQLLGGYDTGERSTGNLCSPGSHVVVAGKLVKDHCIKSNSPTYYGDQWVKAEVEVRGGQVVKHFINNVLVFEYSQPQYDAEDPDGKQFIMGTTNSISEGYVAFQAESHPTEFRNIELMLLQPSPVIN